MKIRKRYRIHLLVATGLLLGYWFILPDVLFQDPFSTVLEDAEGKLLGASIADDGQWRFPALHEVPQKFSTAITTFEDKRFWHHPGVDPLALGRAIKQDVEARSVVSGGSTLTMQVIRLSRKGKPRTLFEKLVELILATRLEFRDTKQEILALYASHAPFGGNIVGLEAACWRYFGRDPAEISWAEAAMLAVLPNAPSLIHPGRNRDQLKAKRDHLLDQLLSARVIDETTCRLAKAESLPQEPRPLPQLAPHLLQRITKEGGAGQRIRSTLRYNLQERAIQVVRDHVRTLSGNQIFNGAAVIANVRTGHVVAYVGNAGVATGSEHGDKVDVVVSPRSTGSILKPFLYAASLDEGKILPATLLPDVPILINGFAPKNFSHDYDGVVPADKALIRSLNIPAVQLLQVYRYEKFHAFLSGIGMTTLDKPADHYGLSLILGGAEGTLWDLVGMYGSMARTLINFNERPGARRYARNDFHPLRYVSQADDTLPASSLAEGSWLGAGSIYATFDALQAVYRPGELSGWQYFTNAKRIAWKTGTSFGFRDAWAIGVTPEYVVGVWVGNADGEGRPGLTGTETAAPIMFELFNQLPVGNTWFSRPDMDMSRVSVCAKSGYRNGPHCPDTDMVWTAISGLQSKPCPYHQRIHVSLDGRFRLNTSCESTTAMRGIDWFVLPPAEAYYYCAKNVSYQSLPPFRDDCGTYSPLPSMQMIYPKRDAKVFVPRELDGKPGRAVFQAAHRDPEATVHWHLDGRYLGSTVRAHQMAINPGFGAHTLVLMDEFGDVLEEQFEVLSRL